MNVKQKQLEIAALLLTTITCSSCTVMVEVVPPVVSAMGSYFSYKTSKIEPVVVTTISKDCYLKTYTQISCDLRKSIRATDKGEMLLKQISDENRLYMENCPNAVKPDPISCN